MGKGKAGKRQDRQHAASEAARAKTQKQKPAVTAQLPTAIDQMMQLFLSVDKDGRRSGAIMLFAEMQQRIGNMIEIDPDSTSPGFLQLRLIANYCQQVIAGHVQLHGALQEIALSGPAANDEPDEPDSESPAEPVIDDEPEASDDPVEPVSTTLEEGDVVELGD